MALVSSNRFTSNCRGFARRFARRFLRLPSRSSKGCHWKSGSQHTLHRRSSASVSPRWRRTATAGLTSTAAGPQGEAGCPSTWGVIFTLRYHEAQRENALLSSLLSSRTSGRAAVFATEMSSRLEWWLKLHVCLAQSPTGRESHSLGMFA